MFPNFATKFHREKFLIFDEIQINPCVVKSLQNEYRALDKIGYNLRKSSPGTKIKIFICKQKYKLLVKAPKDKIFSELYLSAYMLECQLDVLIKSGNPR